MKQSGKKCWSLAITHIADRKKSEEENGVNYRAPRTGAASRGGLLI